MLITILGLGILFIGLAYVLTPNNAPYLLSGYNEMNEAEKASFDLRAFLRFYKRFHLVLGLSLIVVGTLLHVLLNETAAGLFLMVYPISAYLYFGWRNMRFGTVKTPQKVMLVVLAATLILVVGLLSTGIKEDSLTCTSEGIILSGWYGETIRWGDVASVELVANHPKLSYKKNGFALGNIRKGYFGTTQNQTVKLLLNADQKPLICIRLRTGQERYFSSKSRSNSVILDELKSFMPPTP